MRTTEAKQTTTRNKRKAIWAYLFSLLADGLLLTRISTVVESCFEPDNPDRIFEMFRCIITGTKQLTKQRSLVNWNNKYKKKLS